VTGSNEVNGPASAGERLLAKVVELRPGEAAGLAISFAFFFTVLTAYYIIRPVRDEMGVMLTKADAQALHTIFVYVFVVMLAAVPLFGLVMEKVALRHVVPVVYGFFIVNLLGFWFVLENGGQTRGVAQVFFVWVSVFNLFVVSLFWSTLSELWRTEQAKRLFGFVAAGGSLGALAGPLIAQSLVRRIGTDNLLLISAAFLGLALMLALALRRVVAQGDGTGREGELRHSGILAGAMIAWRSPYLFRIALWVLLANLILTYFYLEQARIVGASVPERAARVELLARVDLAVSLLTIALQVFMTGRVMTNLGLGLAIACVPVVAICGFAALAVAPTLGVILAIMIAERSLGFGFANPAARVLWTVVDREAKYKAQSFVDTVVFRGGDAASGWVFGALSKSIGLGGAGIALVTVPFAVGWLILSLGLVRMHTDLAAKSAAKDAGGR
jgi:AAA family ATP:ADP antiporter